ncbi:MAG: hypothetical protein H7A19_01175 [Rhodanobacteraceae bacterium]|nr:hypothetical protein [Rhodanobacteraceae bacterium]
MAMSSSFKLLAVLTLTAAALMHGAPTPAQSSSARAVAGVAALLPSYQDDYGDWRQQIRVASPTRYGRWNSAPAGAVRVYNRRFDPRWNWRSAPRYRVVYTYYRGDMWFLDPTTGWAYSIDRYGIVYTADPYRGWVYSLGPLTRWTADLLYFFDLYRFDRGYWYCRDYDYLVDLWEGDSRYGYYTYDTAYSTLWGWEPYFSSPSFISYSNEFTVIWVRQVRSNYDYFERNPRYRRELIDNIGLPAVNAAPPRTVSPRAVTTSAYWEARDLAAAGLQPPPRGRDTGRDYSGLAAGTVVDARQAPARVVEPGAPAPGFNAPFPSGGYGFGVPADSRGRDAGAAGRTREADLSGAEVSGRDWNRSVEPAARLDESVPDNSAYGRGRDSGTADGRFGVSEPAYRGEVPTPRTRVREDSRQQFGAPTPTPQIIEPQPQSPRSDWSGGAWGRARDLGGAREQPRYEAPREQPRYEAPREQPRYEAPREQPRYEAPREQPRFEAPREQPRVEAPREERQQEDRGEQQEQRSSSRAALSGLGVRDRED